MSSLFTLPPGVTGRVTALPPEPGLRRRLLELGLVEGAAVTCLQPAAAGDPTVYTVRGAVVALRRQEATRIRIQREVCT